MKIFTKYNSEMLFLQIPNILTHLAMKHGWTWGENIKKEQQKKPWNLIYKINNILYQISGSQGIHEA